PDYDHFNTNYYFAFRRAPRFHERQASASATVISARGCPFNCSFCFNSFRDRTVRKHDINAVVEKMAQLRDRFRVTNFQIGDDLFLMDRPRVKVFCERLMRDLPDIRWACQARPSLLREDDLPLFQLMKQSGCFQLAYGMETGSDELLKKLKGNDSSIEKNRLALDLAWQAGISVFGFFMCGIPGETEEQMAMTGDFIKENLARMRLVELFIYTPYPGSKLAEEVQKLGLLEGVTMDELSMNNLVEGNIRVFNPAMPAEKVLKFRKEIKRLVMQRHPLKDKLMWLFVNTMEDPVRTFRRLKALYG
ncbi:MAG: radical SAM protein, partial [Kiritimatiellia bacterium]